MLFESVNVIYVLVISLTFEIQINEKQLQCRLIETEDLIIATSFLEVSVFYIATLTRRMR